VAARLRAAADAPEPRAGAAPADEAVGLLDQRRALLADRRELDRRLSALVTLQGDADGFAGEAAEQASRLRTLGLLPRPDDMAEGAACPVCGSDHVEDPGADQIRAALEQLSAEIVDARRSPPSCPRRRVPAGPARRPR
jgi:hypothetical protein